MAGALLPRSRPCSLGRIGKGSDMEVEVERGLGRTAGNVDLSRGLLFLASRQEGRIDRPVSGPETRLAIASLRVDRPGAGTVAGRSLDLKALEGVASLQSQESAGEDDVRSELDLDVLHRDSRDDDRSRVPAGVVLRRSGQSVGPVGHVERERAIELSLGVKAFAATIFEVEAGLLDRLSFRSGDPPVDLGGASEFEVVHDLHLAGGWRGLFPSPARCGARRQGPRLPRGIWNPAPARGLAESRGFRQISAPGLDPAR